MYKEHFGLKSLPFSISPDPRYLYMSEQHREALAHLVYGIKNDSGFVLLTGEVGTGKTTVCRCLFEQLPDDVDIAFLLNPKLSAGELLASICDELGIDYPAGTTSGKLFVDRINAYLLETHARGRKTVLVIEEAQNLAPEVLEQIRLLTNLETNDRKLLQIIMIGQPELREMLARPGMKQLSQRITARYHLCPLSKPEVAAYIAHRLSVSGAPADFFPPSAAGTIHRLSSGIPRMINLICDRALLGAYSQGKDHIDTQTVEEAAREVSGEPGSGGGQPKILKWIAVFMLLAAFGLAIAAAFFSRKPVPEAEKIAEVPSVVSDPAEPPKTDTLRWPDGLPMEQSRALAFRAVFSQWDLPYETGQEDVCKQASALGFRCFDSLGSLESLRGLNRPAVLKFYDESGREFYAAVTAMMGKTARLEIGHETKTIGFDEIGRLWYGEFTLLWKPPREYTVNILPGDKGPAVSWIERQLDRIDGIGPGRNRVAIYDDMLSGRVKKFQRERGIVPDGVVGSQTIIHLLNASGSPGPQLQESAGER